MSTRPAPVTTGKASLVGGVVVGVAGMVLWLAVTRELGVHGTAILVMGLLVSAAAGTWTRMADL